MTIGPTKCIDIATSAISMIRRCRSVIQLIIADTDAAIAKRVVTADALREVIDHLELSRELSGTDQLAEISRAENAVRRLLNDELNADQLAPLLRLRQSFYERDKSMRDFLLEYDQLLSSALEVAELHADQRPSLLSRLKRRFGRA